MIAAKVIWEEVSTITEIEDDVHDMKQGIERDWAISMAAGLAAIQLGSSDYEKIGLYLGIPRSWVQAPLKRLKKQEMLFSNGVISGDKSMKKGDGIAWLMWSGVGAGVFECSAS